MPATKGTGRKAAEGLSAAGGGSQAGSRLFLSRRRATSRILYCRHAGILPGRGNCRAFLLRDERQGRDDAGDERRRSAKGLVERASHSPALRLSPARAVVARLSLSAEFPTNDVYLSSPRAGRGERAGCRGPANRFAAPPTSPSHPFRRTRACACQVAHPMRQGGPFLSP